MFSINKNNHIALGVLLLLCTIGLGQTPPAANNAKVDTVKKEKKKKSFRPTGIRIGTDLIAIGKTIFDKDKTELELNCDVQFYRYLLNITYGRFSIDRQVVNGSLYSNSGSYLKAGIDINLLKKEANNNVLFFGLRYGRSSFEDKLSYQYSSAKFGVVKGTASNSSIQASWIEAVAGLKLHIKYNIWLGYTARLKFRLKTNESSSLEPYDVPGYGLASEATYWGFNYYIIYRIPFKIERLQKDGKPMKL